MVRLDSDVDPKRYPFVMELRKLVMRLDWSAKRLTEKAKTNYNETCRALRGRHTTLRYAMRLGRAVKIKPEKILSLWEKQDRFWQEEIRENRRQLEERMNKPVAPLPPALPPPPPPYLYYRPAGPDLPYAMRYGKSRDGEYAVGLRYDTILWEGCENDEACYSEIKPRSIPAKDYPRIWAVVQQGQSWIEKHRKRRDYIE